MAALEVDLTVQLARVPARRSDKDHLSLGVNPGQLGSHTPGLTYRCEPRLHPKTVTRCQANPSLPCQFSVHIPDINPQLRSALVDQGHFRVNNAEESVS